MAHGLAMGVRRKSIDDDIRHLRRRSRLVEVFLFLGIGDESHLKEDRRACRLEQHPESRLAHTAILAVEVSDETFLHLFSEKKRLLHVTVLHQFEHDIGVDGVRVKTLIGRLVVRLQLHHGVLAHSDIQVLLHLIRTKDEGLHAPRFFLVRRVGMDRDEQVGIVLIRDIGAGLQGHKHVGRTGIHDVDLRILLYEQFTHFERQLQVQIFLIRELTDSSGVLSAMPGIEHDGVLFLRQHWQAKQHHQQYIYPFSHNTPI